MDSKYIALKIYTTSKKDHQNNEVTIYHRLNTVNTDHPGRRFIRKLFDHFSIAGPHGKHVCLVHEPLGISAAELLKWTPGQVMTLEDLKPCIRQLLVVGDFLHSVAGVVHTDLQLKNLLLPTPTLQSLSNFEERNITTQSARKVLSDRTIYPTSCFSPGDGLPLLTDFGEARFGDQFHDEDIMANAHRAPEVILKSNWDYKVDVWGVAMVAWEIVNPSTLINGKNPDGIFDDRVHIAESVALLGPPPEKFREKHHLSSVFWDERGDWRGLVPVPDISFEGLSVDVKGKDRDGFLRWMRMALRWNPEDRSDALGLLYDEWMMEGLRLPGK